MRDDEPPTTANEWAERVAKRVGFLMLDRDDVRAMVYHASRTDSTPLQSDTVEIIVSLIAPAAQRSYRHVVNDPVRRDVETDAQRIAALAVVHFRQNTL